MENKGVLYNMGGWSQFFFLCFLSFSGLIIASLIMVLCFDMSDIWQSASSIRMAQTIQAVFMFLFSAFAFAYLCEGKVKSYLKASDSPDITFLLLAVCLIVFIQPVVYTMSYYNQQLVLPDFLSPLEQWMAESEASAEKTMNLLFSDKSVSGLIFNLLVIAVVAGLVEEIFFRGCLQQIMQKVFSNMHVVIWVTAIIFSAIHFQFYGFFPRVLLGALLGYLFFWSGNIWVPVIVHTVHNGLNVVLSHIYFGTADYAKFESFAFGENRVLVLASLALSSLFVILLFRKRSFG